MEEFRFKKRYGQNFLKDNNIIRKMVNDIDVKEKSLVIEIGCGDGRLTKILCEKFDNVLGYEIDLEVKDRLFLNLAGYDNYEIIFDDFLKRDIKKDIKVKYDSLYIIANLPYYITTSILEKIIDSDLDFELMRVMVQKEVGDRICARVGSREYNSLTVYLNYKYDIKKNFIVKRECFIPKPNVDSLIISFSRKKDKYFVKDERIFYKLVRDSFRFKRKTLKNNLKEYDLDTISKVLSRYNLDLSVRAENIDIFIFCEISNSLSI